MDLGIASVNPRGNHSCVAHGNSAMRHDRGMPESHAEPMIARRLRRLLEHLDISAEEFAERTGLKASYVSRLLSGERGASGDAPKLFLGTSKAFGLGGHYWSARDDLDPAACLHSPDEESRSMAKADNIQARLVRLSADRDDPADVVKELAKTKAPAGADAMWWFQRYLELLDAQR